MTTCRHSPLWRVIALLFTFSSASSIASAADLPVGQQRFAEGKDLRIEFYLSGVGPTVLLHPSLGRGAVDFNDLVVRLNLSGYRTATVNPRGIGGSKGSFDGATLHDIAADVRRVADALELRKVHLIGQNFGNRVARTASADQPKRVLSITCMAAGGEIPAQPEIIDALKRCFDETLSEADHLTSVHTAFFSPWRDPRPWKDGWHAEVATAESEAGQRTPLEDWYAGGLAPMLVIQGLDDVVAPPQNGWNLVNNRANARLVALPACGHAMLPEQPRAIGDAVISFLNEQPRPQEVR